MNVLWHELSLSLKWGQEDTKPSFSYNSSLHLLDGNFRRQKSVIFLKEIKLADKWLGSKKNEVLNVCLKNP